MEYYEVEIKNIKLIVEGITDEDEVDRWFSAEKISIGDEDIMAILDGDVVNDIEIGIARITAGRATSRIDKCLVIK